MTGHSFLEPEMNLDVPSVRVIMKSIFGFKFYFGKTGKSITMMIHKSDQSIFDSNFVSQL